MDHIWSPWRYRFIAEKGPQKGCIFCEFRDDPSHDEQNLVVYRGENCFVVLNLYPYTSGHLMVVPYPHVAKLSGVDGATLQEMMLVAQRGEHAFDELYHPDGMNLGMNIGAAAGAGVAEHIHLHVLGRWFGDANFLSTVGETRILPEELPVTWKRLKGVFDRTT